MDYVPSRLRRGELIVGGGAVVLAVALFVLPWYGVPSPYEQTLASLGAPTSFTGWNGLSHIRWLVLITILLAFALVWLQGARRAPALPATFSVVVTVVSVITVLGLIYRVLIDVPDAASHLDRRVGAYVGLLAAIAIFYGGYESMRQEGQPEPDGGAGEMETVSV